ncbi:unnamed protein product [marine sediment metagenome]|uniref:Uncharacterized protein n=1 Tax=marine sediment metagenome TaxID=412755 RepID=X1L3V8_9ZZZZ
MPEPGVLIAMPVDYPGYVVPGSLHGVCHKCRRGVWIAPSSWLILHDNPDIEVLCWVCAFAGMEKAPGEFMALTPAQLQEIEEWRR